MSDNLIEKINENRIKKEINCISKKINKKIK